MSTPCLGFLICAMWTVLDSWNCVSERDSVCTIFSTMAVTSGAQCTLVESAGILVGAVSDSHVAGLGGGLRPQCSAPGDPASVATADLAPHCCERWASGSPHSAWCLSFSRVTPPCPSPVPLSCDRSPWEHTRASSPIPSHLRGPTPITAVAMFPLQPHLPHVCVQLFMLYPHADVHTRVPLVSTDGCPASVSGSPSSQPSGPKPWKRP